MNGFHLDGLPSIEGKMNLLSHDLGHFCGGCIVIVWDDTDMALERKNDEGMDLCAYSIVPDGSIRGLRRAE